MTQKVKKNHNFGILYKNFARDNSILVLIVGKWLEKLYIIFWEKSCPKICICQNFCVTLQVAYEVAQEIRQVSDQVI